MKYLIVSDTHGYLKNIKNVLDKIGDRIHGVIHLGDHDSDARILSKAYPGLEFFSVKGNNDYNSDVPYEKILILKDKRILLTHGHRQNVYWNFETISYFAEEQNAEMALFGHTHVPLNDRGGRVWLFNPGSISMPRSSMIPTFGILEILDNGKIDCCVMEYLGKDNFRRAKF